MTMNDDDNHDHDAGVHDIDNDQDKTGDGHFNHCEPAAWSKL